MISANRDSETPETPFTQEEAEKRRDDLLRKLLHTPPKQRPKRDRESPTKKPPKAD
jgi:hypothetical protein